MLPIQPKVLVKPDAVSAEGRPKSETTQIVTRYYQTYVRIENHTKMYQMTMLTDKSQELMHRTLSSRKEWEGNP